MLLNNPLNGIQNEITEVEGKLYWGTFELKEITEEQKKVSKTGANYYFEHDANENKFFVHLNQEDKTFFIAETFDNNSHTVWLTDNNSITFHNNNNIVFRNERVQRSFAHQNKDDANKVIKYHYEKLKGESEFVLFNDPLKDNDSDKVYLERLNDKWFRQSEELKPITEEQKQLSKTDANYSIVNSLGTFLFHVDEKNKKVTLAETIDENEHTVWLKDKGRITYFKNHTVVTTEGQFSTNSKPYNGHPDLSDLIKQSYSEFSTYQPVINTELFNPASAQTLNFPKHEEPELFNPANAQTLNFLKHEEPELFNPASAQTLNFPKNEHENTFNPASGETLNFPKNKKEENIKIAEKLGYLQGLRKELRSASEDKTTLLHAAYGVKDFVAKGAGLKEKKFLKLGAAAGAVAIIAATPVAGPVAAVTALYATLITLGAAVEATFMTSMYTADYIGDKIKNSLGKNEQSSIEPKAKSISDVKSSISKMRSEAFDNNNPQNQHKIK